MATKEKQKVGLDQVNFLPLGAQSKGEEEEVIVDETEEIQEQEEEETPDPEQEDPEVEGQEDPDPAEEEEPEIEEEIEEEEEIEDPDPDTSEEEEEGGEEEEETSIFASALEGKGIDLKDEAFEGINFDDPDTKDLSQFIDVVSEKLSQTKLNELFEEMPEVKGMMEFAQNGGDPRQYIETMYPQFDYTKVDFDEQVAENEQAQEQLIRNQLQADEVEEEEIDEIIEDYRAGGLLEKQAKRSLKKLAKMQEQYQEDLVKQQEKAVEARKEAARKERQKIEETIENSKAIKGLKLPKTDKEDLKNYLFEPVNDKGHSQAYVDGQQMSEEERIAVAYLKMKGFDFESLIGNEAETRNAQKLRKTIKKSKDDKMTKKKSKTTKTSGKIQDIKPIF